MRLIDLYFKAFNAYKKVTQENTQSERDRKIIMHANAKDDFLTAIKYDCKIDSDWVENIEEGLKYVEKAIQEDRQFIRTEGSVVQIEKVKKTSKATIEHLAKHSELITRKPKAGSNLIPDKLYIVEKLSDYTVYENRFLYMLLRYLKDFVQMRLDNIKDKVTTYESHVKINKDIKVNETHIQYKLDYDAIHKNDILLTNRSHDIPLMNRVENIYALVNSFLSTPLMKEVSKAPMIKPPIVKTNVLLMNQNFRAAVALYEFIRSYNKDGYQFTEKIHKLNPFPNDLGDEMAQIIELTGAVSYTFGQDIKKELNEKLEAEFKLIKEKEKQKALQELKRLKKTLSELNEDPTAYILKLEKYNLDLERRHNAFTLEVERIPELELNLLNLKNDNEKLMLGNLDLSEQVHTQNNQLKKFKQKYFDDFNKAEKLHQDELTSIRNLMDEEISKLTLYFENKLEVLKENHEQRLAEQQQHHETYIKNQELKHDTEITDLNISYKQLLDNQANEHKNQLLTYDEKTTKLNEDINLLKSEILELHSMHQLTVDSYLEKVNNLEDELNTTRAQMFALKQQHNLMTEDDKFTTREKFQKLETEMKAYKKFFKNQWTLTKQQIKQKVKQEINPEPTDNDSKDDKEQIN